MLIAQELLVPRMRAWNPTRRGGSNIAIGARTATTRQELWSHFGVLYGSGGGCSWVTAEVRDGGAVGGRGGSTGFMIAGRWDGGAGWLAVEFAMVG